MKIKLLSILLITFQPLVFGANDIPERPLYLDPSQPIRTRVENLMSLMTLKEKIAQMCQYVGLEHMRDAEKNITEEELLNGHARGFYKGLHSTGVERMVTQGEIGSFLHVLTPAEANHLQKLAEKSRLKIPLLIGTWQRARQRLYHLPVSNRNGFHICARFNRTGKQADSPRNACDRFSLGIHSKHRNSL